MDTGLIHIYCGDGKGKTTAALGLTIRCAGQGGHILFAQFLKSRPTGELSALQRFDTITVLRSKGVEKFTFQMTPDELAATKTEQTALFDTVMKTCRQNRPDMVVLDEILPACTLGLVDEQAVLAFLDSKAATLEVVMTGRTPPASFLSRADYVSEICKRKHPFDRGIGARIGIEE
ncbi:cob(I)yrinic acid a,c-diamide adenosyltransferase [uncultured Megasphaera sp.]|uniref:cob(I)yrinic acid a,c-diamide adenosyltransferase n=1 Tax=uncultured Megasphaera sp. TaxID=165188 RepID=UPI002658513A|nr:cob(I)yrinic acid a,c-diamide adenosyltransferase [uncultured Megasphaera sp.]